jgi:hypothetical protein
MSDHHPLETSIVRILDARDAIFGAGFLAAPELVCTCAHVVAEALNISPETEQQPEGEVHLDFPFLGGAKVHACVKVWVPVEPNGGGGDIAVLRLTGDPPSAARPVRLLPVSHLSGRDFVAYGFPRTTDIGQYAYGILRDRLANGYIQLEGTTRQGYRIQQGYSGTPVWGSNGRGVVGMVVAEEKNPEAKVAFLIPNDLILQACPDIKPITLHQLFAPLTEGLAGLPGSPLSGVEQFLREYLGTPEVPAPFGGRHVQLAELDHWLDTPAQPYALLVADAGRGKSALLAHWVAKVADEHRAEVVLVPISIRFGTSLKSTTVSLLGARLRHLHHARADLPYNTEGWLAEIDRYLREDRPDGPPLLIVLDGADEAADWMVGRDLRFPPEPGSGIKVLVSARSLADCDVAGWVRRLEWQGVAVPMELPLLDRDGVIEVLRSMGDPLAGLVPQVDVVGELYRLSKGDPLLVRLYVEALRQTGHRAAFLKLEDLKDLEPGLGAYFDQWWKDQEWLWERQGRDLGSEREDLMDFFRLCAIALGPLSRDDVADIVGGRLKSGSRLRTVATEAGRFIIGDGHTQGFTFSHPRFSYYFSEEQMTRQEGREWEQRFLDFGQHTLAVLNSGKLDPGQAPPYAVRYYGAHLERAGADPDLFHELVCEGWQRAWEALEGTYDGFLSDLARAWKRAEVSTAHEQSVEDRSRAIGRQCRYALIVASIKSLAGNIHPALLAALVDKGVWTPIQGLAYARQIPNDERRAQALVLLAPHLSEPLLQEALAAARAIVGQDRRVQALAGLAPYLSEPLRATVLQEALAEARAIAAKYRRVQALTDLVPRLSEPLRATVLQEALAEARAIAVKYSRVQALTDLAPHLSEPLRATVLQEALAEARAIANADARTRALTDLAPHLPESLQVSVLQEALTAAWAIESEDARTRALALLAPHLSEPLRVMVLQEALTAARAIANGDAVGEYWRAQALAGLAPHLSEPLLQEALAAARTIKSDDARAQALAGLVPHLSEPLQVTVLQEALAAAWTIENEDAVGEYWRAQALTDLAPHLSEPLRVMVLQEALTEARVIESEEARAQALTDLAPHLSEPLRATVLQEALAEAQAIVAKYSRVQALAGLAPYLSEPLRVTVLQEALAEAQAIADVDARAHALTLFAPHLSEPLLQEALAEARAIADVDARAQSLALLAPYLSEPLRATVLQEVLAEARAIESENARAQMLALLAPHLSEPLLQEALTAAQTITDMDARAQALALLAPHLSEPLLQEALTVVQAIADGAATGESWRARALTLLAPHLSESLQVTVLQEALAEARAIVDADARAQALALLAPHLSESLRTTVLQEALTAARMTTDMDARAQALALLAPHLSEPLLQEALTEARAIEREDARAQALAGLAPYLSEPLRVTVLQEALTEARAIEREDALAEYWRARVLSLLAPHLSESLLQEALTVAREIESEDARAQALEGLVPHVKQLPVVRLYSLWCETLRRLATRTRRDLLSDIQALVPVIAALGGREALVATAQAIIEVGKWFP